MFAMSLSEIGKELNLNRSEVDGIIRCALRKLRKHGHLKELLEMSQAKRVRAEIYPDWNL